MEPVEKGAIFVGNGVYVPAHCFVHGLLQSTRGSILTKRT